MSNNAAKKQMSSGNLYTQSVGQSVMKMLRKERPNVFNKTATAAELNSLRVAKKMSSMR